jgi:hypothetical protein
MGLIIRQNQEIQGPCGLMDKAPCRLRIWGLQVRVLPGSKFYSTDLVPKLLDHGVVGVLVGHVEGGVDGAAVGVLQSKIILYKDKQIAKKINMSNGVFSCFLKHEVDQRAFTKAEFLNVYEAKESFPGLLKSLESRSLVI